MSLAISESVIGYLVGFYVLLAVVIFFKLKQPVSAPNLEAIAPTLIRSCWVLLIVLFVFALFVSISAGFIAQQDAAWHQVAMRNVNERIPGRLIIYSVFYPAYLIMGGGIAFYAKTRLPHEQFDAKFKGALLCITLTPFMFLPSQDPEMMGFSADLFHILFRLSYWLMMSLWIISMFYLLLRLVSIIIPLMKPTG